MQAWCGPQAISELWPQAGSIWPLSWSYPRFNPGSDPDLLRGSQAISELRAKLSGGWYPLTPSETNDQNILQSDNQTPNLVPSQGYTYPRNPGEVRASSPLILNPNPVHNPKSACWTFKRTPHLSSHLNVTLTHRVPSDPRQLTPLRAP